MHPVHQAGPHLNPDYGDVVVMPTAAASAPFDGRADFEFHSLGVAEEE
jgi:hypothetical protein